jgi:hypothetical protein
MDMVDGIKRVYFEVVQEVVGFFIEAFRNGVAVIV